MTAVQWTRCDCGLRFPRPRGEIYDRCLGCVVASRMPASGIGWDDPGLAHIRDWNFVIYATTAQAGAA